MPKPGDVFVGVIDLFAIVLPGALLTALLMAIALDRDVALSQGMQHLHGAAGWVAFVVASYVLGHVLSGLGALLLDRAYDGLYRDGYLLGKQWWIIRRPKQKRPAAPKDRGEARRYDALADRARAKATRESTIDSANLNVYAWAVASVVRADAGATTDVERRQADSKFFRSLVLVVTTALIGKLVGADYVLGEMQWLEVVMLLALLLLSLWRFVELRLSATIRVYESYLQPMPAAKQDATGAAGS